MKYFCSIFLFLSSFSISAATIDDVARFYDQLLDFVSSDNKKVCSYFHYSATMKYRNNEYPQTSTETKVYRKATDLYISSGPVDVWKVNDDFVLIMHSNKTINKSKAAEGSESEALAYNMKRLFEFQKELFKNPENVVEKHLNSSTIQVLLYPNTDIEQAYKIKSVEFIFNSTTKKVENMIMKYSTNHQLERQEIKYLTVEYNSKHKMLEGDPIGKIFSKNGRLIGKYEHYSLIK